MAFKKYSIGDLAYVSGRPEDSYLEFAETAIEQALLLFKMATGLTGVPESPEYAGELVRNAVCSLADRLYLAQPYAEDAAKPYMSETILGYSYSKALAAVMSKEKTGVMFFDMAVQELSVKDVTDGLPTGGGVEIFEHDADYSRGSWSGGGNVRWNGPYPSGLGGIQG